MTGKQNEAAMPPLVLEDFIPYRLNKAAEAISQRFASQYRDEYGLTRPEWRTLATLGQFGAVGDGNWCTFIHAQDKGQPGCVFTGAAPLAQAQAR